MNIDLKQNLQSVDDGVAEKAKLLQRQKNATNGLSEKQLKQAKKVSDFEGLFIGMMVKSMRDSVGNDKLTVAVAVKRSSARCWIRNMLRG